VTRAVITVPAYFTERQKASTALAARMAGLEVRTRVWL
jgi:molecular chaperone DnaK (HSP70)